MWFSLDSFFFNYFNKKGRKLVYLLHSAVIQYISFTNNADFEKHKFFYCSYNIIITRDKILFIDIFIWWQIPILGSGLAEEYTLLCCTIPLDLTFRSVFATVFSIEEFIVINICFGIIIIIIIITTTIVILLIRNLWPVTDCYQMES